MDRRLSLFLLVVTLVASPSRVSAQAFGAIFDILQQIEGGNLYVAPVGWLWGDGLEAFQPALFDLKHDDLLEVGFEVQIRLPGDAHSAPEDEDEYTEWVDRFVAAGCRAHVLHINVGIDYLTGFTATAPSLDLRGTIRTLPTVTGYWWPKQFQLVRNCEKVDDEPQANEIIALYLGAGSGISTFRTATADVPGSPDLALQMKSTSMLFAASLGIQFFEVIFVEASWRFRRFRGVEWFNGKDPVAGPRGWPRSIDIGTLMLRIGSGLEF